jgi:hypothetical protein
VSAGQRAAGSIAAAGDHIVGFRCHLQLDGDDTGLVAGACRNDVPMVRFVRHARARIQKTDAVNWSSCVAVLLKRRDQGHAHAPDRRSRPR